MIVQGGTDHSCPKRYKPLGDSMHVICAQFRGRSNQVAGYELMVECMMLLQNSVGRVIIGALRLASLTKIYADPFWNKRATGLQKFRPKTAITNPQCEKMNKRLFERA
jgi:hypothetical protein